MITNELWNELTLKLNEEKKIIPPKDIEDNSYYLMIQYSTKILNIFKQVGIDELKKSCPYYFTQEEKMNNTFKLFISELDNNKVMTHTVEDTFIGLLELFQELIFSIQDNQEKYREYQSLMTDIQEIFSEKNINFAGSYIDTILIRIRNDIFNYKNNELDKKVNNFNKLSEEIGLLELIKDKKLNATFLNFTTSIKILASQKRYEKNITFVLLSALSIMLLVFFPVIYIFLYSYFNYEILSLKTIIPNIFIVSVELIIIYLLRLTVKNYQTIKAQVVQLEYRAALCEFIGGYSEFAKQNKQQDIGTELVLFEKMMFTELSEDLHKLPMPFEEIEKITELVKVIKGTDSNSAGKK